jgi:hypothetical protein
MAGEYSRELSVKVFAGKCRLIELGFRQGGQAGYGLRRLLLDQAGNRKCLLKAGERKSLTTDRVILIPGPDTEIEIVREIYSRYAQELQSCDTISDALNARNILTENGGRWTRAIVKNILTNLKYIGVNVSNRSSYKLNKVHVKNPPRMWVRRNDAFEPIVSAEAFRKAQETLAARNRRFSNDDMLDLLRGLWKTAGYLSNALIDKTSGMPSRAVYHQRFKGMLNAYALIGYHSARNYSFVNDNKSLQSLREEYMNALVAELESVGASVQADSAGELLTINDKFSVAYILVRCRETKHRGLRWQFRIDDSHHADITVAARMAVGNDTVLDYYLFPRGDLVGEDLDLAIKNTFLLDVYRFENLSFLKDLARQSDSEGLK